jgi:hypothetical protein
MVQPLHLLACLCYTLSRLVSPMEPFCSKGIGLCTNLVSPHLWTVSEYLIIQSGSTIMPQPLHLLTVLC